MTLGLKQAPLLSLGPVINRNKKEYYAQLASHSKTLDINNWLEYFSDVILNAQKYSQAKALAVIEKTELLESFSEQLNSRQIKLLNKLYSLLPNPFEGRVSAEKYISMTKCSRASATRDLKHLVDLRILVRKGERRHTRYFLKYTQVLEHKTH